MARNEEKQLGRLNRWYLEKDKQEQLKKNPKRPKLMTLHTVEEIKKWIPSIKKDIDFNLKQSMVPCYPEGKIQEFHSEVDRLQREYKAYIHKLLDLDPSLKGQLPWEDRPYSRKRDVADDIEASRMDASRKQSKLEDGDRSNEGIDDETMKHKIQPAAEPKTKFTRIDLPILHSDSNSISTKSQEEVVQELGHFNSTHTLHELEDKPLIFTRQTESDRAVSSNPEKCNGCQPEYESSTLPQNVDLTNSVTTGSVSNNVLGLDYSSSDEDT